MTPSRRKELIAAVAKVGVPESVRRIKSVVQETTESRCDAPKDGGIAAQQYCCINNIFTPRREKLTLGRVYEIDPRRDIETNIKGDRYYFVHGHRYGAWRFEQVGEG